MVDHEKLRRVYKRKLKRLRLIDDSFMTRFFRGNIEGTELLVRTILERSDLSIESVSTQETLVNPGRSVGLDILASDGSGALYNIEVQRDNARADFRRACLHASSIMTHHCKPQSEPKDFPQTYVIFITEDDYWKKGLLISHAEWMLREGKEEISNSCQHIIYVNGKYRRGKKPLALLMHDFFCRNPNNMHHKILADRARYLKEDEEGVDFMCREFEEVREMGVKLGVKMGREEREREIVANSVAKGRSLGEIADFLNCPLATVRKIVAQLNACKSASR